MHSDAALCIPQSRVGFFLFWGHDSYAGGRFFIREKTGLTSAVLVTARGIRLDSADDRTSSVVGFSAKKLDFHPI